MIQGFRSLDRVLRGDATHPARLGKGEVDIRIRSLLLVMFVLAAFYGVCMGSFALVSRWGTPRMNDGLLQMASSAIKVPALLILTLFVTTPSLYVFNALLGSRLTFGSLLKLLTASVAVLTALLGGFGLILAFFSLVTTTYSFIVLLNVALFAVSGLLGLRFLRQTLHRLAMVPVSTPGLPPEPVAVPDPADPASPPPLPVDVVQIPGPLDRVADYLQLRSVRRMFSIWIVVFGLVGSQMSWVLRPFILAPNSNFTVFRKRDSNFFEAVAQKAADLFDSSTPKSKSRGWN